MISIRDLTKVHIRRDSAVTALRHVSLEIPKGEIFGIAGYSGAGKSTLLRCINRLVEPDAGSIAIDNRDVTHIQGKALLDLRRQIGMIFQNFNLFSQKTVEQNVAFPLDIAGVSRSEIPDRVTALLAMTGLQDKRRSYPSELSGGQMQRVGIARALATNPRILLSDEATSALDPETTRSILELLARINAELGVTIVLVTHEIEVIRQLCGQVAIMAEGQVHETGKTESVFENPQSVITKKFLARPEKIWLTGVC